MKLFALYAILVGAFSPTVSKGAPEGVQAPVVQEGWEVRGVWLQPEVLFVLRPGASMTALPIALKTQQSLVRFALERYLDPSLPLFGEQKAWESRIDSFCSQFLKEASKYPRPSVVIDSEKHFAESSWVIEFIPEESEISSSKRAIGPEHGALASALEAIFPGKEPQWSAALLSCRDPAGTRWAHSVMRSFPTLATLLLKALATQSQAAQARADSKKNPKLARAHALTLAVQALEATLQRATGVDTYLSSTLALRALTEAQVAELRSSVVSLRESVSSKLKETRLELRGLGIPSTRALAWQWLWGGTR